MLATISLHDQIVGSSNTSPCHINKSVIVNIIHSHIAFNSHARCATGPNAKAHGHINNIVLRSSAKQNFLGVPCAITRVTLRLNLSIGITIYYAYSGPTGNTNCTTKSNISCVRTGYYVIIALCRKLNLAIGCINIGIIHSSQCIAMNIHSCSTTLDRNAYIAASSYSAAQSKVSQASIIHSLHAKISACNHIHCRIIERCTQTLLIIAATNKGIGYSTAHGCSSRVRAHSHRQSTGHSHNIRIILCLNSYSASAGNGIRFLIRIGSILFYNSLGIISTIIGSVCAV